MLIKILEDDGVTEIDKFYLHEKKTFEVFGGLDRRTFARKHVFDCFFLADHPEKEVEEELEDVEDVEEELEGEGEGEEINDGVS